VTVWLPSEVRDSAPDGVEVVVYDAGDPVPPGIDEVEFYVLPYVFDPEPVRLVARMPRLRVLQTLTAGVDAFAPHVPDGVTLCNARGVHDASTAELAVTLTLAALRRVPDAVRAQARAAWEYDTADSLADRTVLIVGYGSIGAAIERRLEGFECEVLRVARRAREGVEALEALPELLPRADVVVLVVPMTEETRGLVDAAFLARMRDGALLVNVARGPVVVTDALVAELSTGRLRAALDVTDPEPLPPAHPLWRTPNTLITPHVGGNTSAFVPRARALVAEQLRRFTTGEDLLNVVTGAY
jgi:phosphoglycerate dehydrogenase-like enzyme